MLIPIFQNLLLSIMYLDYRTFISSVILNAGFRLNMKTQRSLAYSQAHWQICMFFYTGLVCINYIF